MNARIFIIIQLIMGLSVMIFMATGVHYVALGTFGAMLLIWIALIGYVLTMKFLNWRKRIKNE